MSRVFYEAVVEQVEQFSVQWRWRWWQEEVAGLIPHKHEWPDSSMMLLYSSYVMWCCLGFSAMWYIEYQSLFGFVFFLRFLGRYLVIH